MLLQIIYFAAFPKIESIDLSVFFVFILYSRADVNVLINFALKNTEYLDYDY